MGEPLNLRLTDTAETDLIDIWTYVALDSSDAAASNFVTRSKPRANRKARSLDRAPKP